MVPRVIWGLILSVVTYFVLHLFLNEVWSGIAALLVFLATVFSYPRWNAVP